MKRLVFLVLLTALLPGCAGDPPVQPPPPPPTIVNLQIETSADLNADINGNGAPVMLRIYELREQSNFNSADFFAIFNDEKATLAADLARKQELLLQPGESKSLTLNPADDVQTIGLFAGFRQLDSAQWRAVASVKAHQTQTVNIGLKNNQLTAETAN
ncbi:type VI secretion system lipoprotein TssJ [Methylomonas rivi]|uniref:Type VI secretion system lipoprotein TssJ n=1 Tax=Methylomonas rivi TaxID=2952226 RepID=A0ABT1UA74_9GAMM|nr:type VI secretion system lipoprotein TssJ [Methylomonas sp. WSC-6]MCQ8130764.1 type VI secretion system lipoprotein TssJ [Methylomonas sp. WSC-6]